MNKNTEFDEKEVELFCDTFIQTGSAARAAAKLGLAGDRKEKGEALLRHPQIRKRLLEKYGKIQETYLIECTEVINYLMAVLRMNPTDYVQWTSDKVIVKPSSELTREQAALVSGVKRKVERDGTETVEICLPDKYAAADKLAKIFGLYNERLQITGPGGGPISVQAIPHDLQALAAEFAKQVALQEKEKLKAIEGGEVVQEAEVVDGDC